MSKQISAHQFKQVYQDLGYDLAKLGCIMLDTEPIDVGGVFKEDDLYYAKDKAKFWIDGVVCDKTPHVTLLYGLLRSGLEMKKHVGAVLHDFNFTDVTIENVGYFDSPYEDEPYVCLVAHLLITDQLRLANEHLKFLPHINTFPGFKAHITIAYVKPETAPQYLKQLQDALTGKIIKTKAINYGGDK